MDAGGKISICKRCKRVMINPKNHICKKIKKLGRKMPSVLYIRLDDGLGSPFWSAETDITSCAQGNKEKVKVGMYELISVMEVEKEITETFKVDGIPAVVDEVAKEK